MSFTGCLPFPEDRLVDEPDGGGPNVSDRDASGEVGPDGGMAGDATVAADAADAGQLQEQWTQVAAGRAHACGLTNRGRVFCWGSRDSDQFAGGPAPAPTPKLINFGAGIQIVQIDSNPGTPTTGGDTTCAIDSADNVWCWGANDGQIVSTQPGSSPSPKVLTGGRFTSVNVGVNHACAVATNGEVQCWGQNNSGQVADADVDPVPPFGEAAAGPASVRQVASGNELTYAREDANLWVWGNAEFHPSLCDAVCVIQSGTMCSCPANVPLTDVSDIVTGPAHTCAVSNGTLRCWGENDLLQLGEAVLGPLDFDEAVAVFNAGTPIGNFALGHFHTCAEADGQVHCWGNNANRELGENQMASTTSNSVPSPLDLFDVESIAAGATFTCAVSTGGLECWGDNSSGQLGRGEAATNNAYATPEPVETPW